LVTFSTYKISISLRLCSYIIVATDTEISWFC
jgi:hypothetical protein